MPLTLALLFHFNQHITEHAYLASQVCYRGLLRLLRARPSIKANLHLSGTLIHALQWLDPEPLELVRDGLEDGQFELVGSAYAQNVLYASDDWDNARQIELHLKVLQETFGVTPTAFWVVERCWRQSLVPLIAGAGYRTVLIEDHILEASRAPGAQVYSTRVGSYTLKVARDDEKLKHYFNFAAWFGLSQGLHGYLEQVAQTGGRCLAYAEDAEAMGLWGYSRGVIPEQTWERLGKALDELDGRPDLETGLLAQIPDPVGDRSPIRDGSACWMDASLKQPGLPFHEDGYADWFDFNARSPKLARYRRLHSRVRARLQDSPAEAIQEPGERALRQAALHTFLSHQYEFGCIGIGAGRYRGWEGARAAMALAYAADWAAKRREGLVVEDINDDGYLETCQSDGRTLLVTSPMGGRLLYWFELETGRQVIGNPLAVAPGEYLGDAVLPPRLPCPGRWLPDGEPVSSQSLRLEAPPTRLGKYLPGWVWEGAAEPIPLAVQDMRLPGERPCLAAQRRGFVDELRLDGAEVLPAGEAMELRQESRNILYTRRLAGAITLEKTYRLEREGVTALYRFTNSGQDARRLSLSVTSELCLDHASVLHHGRKALDFAWIDGFPAVTNPLTGDFIRLEASSPWKDTITREALLALELGLAFEIPLLPEAVETLELRLVIGKNMEL